MNAFTTLVLLFLILICVVPAQARYDEVVDVHVDQAIDRRNA